MCSWDAQSLPRYAVGRSGRTRSESQAGRLGVAVRVLVPHARYRYPTVPSHEPKRSPMTDLSRTPLEHWIAFGVLVVNLGWIMAEAGTGERSWFFVAEQAIWTAVLGWLIVSGNRDRTCR